MRAARAWRTRTTSWTRALRPRAPRSTSLPSGSHTIEFWSVDASANVEIAPQERVVRGHHTGHAPHAGLPLLQQAERQPLLHDVHGRAGHHDRPSCRRHTRSTAWHSRSTPSTPPTTLRCTASTTRRTAATSTPLPRPRRPPSSPRCQATYGYDGPAYNVSTTKVAGATTVYRFYNKSNGSHFYTASESEKANVVANLSATYSLDGVAYYLAP